MFQVFTPVCHSFQSTPSDGKLWNTTLGICPNSPLSSAIHGDIQNGAKICWGWVESSCPFHYFQLLNSNASVTLETIGDNLAMRNVFFHRYRFLFFGSAGSINCSSTLQSKNCQNKFRLDYTVMAEGKTSTSWTKFWEILDVLHLKLNDGSIRELARSSTTEKWHYCDVLAWKSGLNLLGVILLPNS